MILCLGPNGVGKTVLLKRLQGNTNDAVNELPATVSTVGTNIMTVKISKKATVTIHELGGTMAPIWDNHLNNCSSLLYVIDVSNLQQVSCACILLLEILSIQDLEDIDVLIVLNKTDSIVATSLNEMKGILRLDDVCRYAKQKIDVVEASCVSGQGLKDVRAWLSSHIVHQK